MVYKCYICGDTGIKKLLTPPLPPGWVTCSETWVQCDCRKYKAPDSVTIKPDVPTLPRIIEERHDNGNV